MQATIIGIGELESLKAQWSGLGIVDKQLQSTRADMVACTEATYMQIVAARTGAIPIGSHHDRSNKPPEGGGSAMSKSQPSTMKELSTS